MPSSPPRCPSFGWFLAASIFHSQQDPRPITLVLLKPSGLGTMTFPDDFLSRNLRDTENSGIPLHHPPHVAPGSLTHKRSCLIVCALLGLSLSLAAVTQIDGFPSSPSLLSPDHLCGGTPPHVCQPSNWLDLCLFIDL